MSPRPATQQVSLPVTIAASVLSGLISVVGAYFTIRNDVSNVQTENVRLQRRIDRVENTQDTVREEGAKRSTEIAVLVSELKTLNEKVQESNDHLSRIEERQVKVIVPAVTSMTR